MNAPPGRVLISGLLTGALIVPLGGAAPTLPTPPSQSDAIQRAKLSASDAAAGASFGFSVALDAGTALVGARYDDTPAGVDAGSSYVWVRSGDGWIEQAKLTAPDGLPGDTFGCSVDVSGDTAVVGACKADTSGGGSDAGSAYVFVRSGTTWSQQASLVAPDGAPGDELGTSVSIDGDTVIVGGPFNDSLAGSGTGAAYIFVRTGTAWTQQAKVAAADAGMRDWFGFAVALQGDAALIGALQGDTASGVRAGSAYVFLRSGTTWSQRAELTSADAEDGDYFGNAVALDADTAVVGARYDEWAGPDSGSAYVFVRSGTTWSQQAKLLPSDGIKRDVFAWSVALSGDNALIGSPFEDDPGGPDSVGAAYVYVRSGTSWVERSKLKPRQGGASDFFGTSVALDPDAGMIGAPYDDLVAGTDAGSAFVLWRSAGPPRFA